MKIISLDFQAEDNKRFRRESKLKRMIAECLDSQIYPENFRKDVEFVERAHQSPNVIVHLPAPKDLAEAYYKFVDYISREVGFTPENILAKDTLFESYWHVSVNNHMYPKDELLLIARVFGISFDSEARNSGILKRRLEQRFAITPRVYSDAIVQEVEDFSKENILGFHDMIYRTLSTSPGRISFLYRKAISQTESLDAKSAFWEEVTDKRDLKSSLETRVG